ncbi:hypothetical protein M5K25_006654 [Dendrobium thyrsiflorum]|uniref:Uncharacterized protein n=1 Tax=Dendrobium thyrsiflorum TaxID=117978 RepID=A0ABD0VBT2_DENTH
MVRGKEKSNASLRRDHSWKYSVQVDIGGAEKTYVYLKCNFCDKVVKGGVTRMKEHLSGSHKNVAPCANVPDKVKEEICAYMKKSITAKHLQQEQFDDRVEHGSYYGSESGKGSSSTIHSRGARGPMDQYMVNPGEDRGQTQMMPAADVASDNEWFIDDETDLPLSDLQLEDLSVDVLRGEADQGGVSTSATPHTSTSSAAKGKRKVGIIEDDEDLNFIDTIGEEDSLEDPFRLYMQGLELNTSSYYKLIEENRFLYNEVQDLKGCIRVYCRVRPFLINISDERSTIDYIGENGSIIIKNPHKQGRDARKIFSFNRVFGMNSTQAEVFADTKSLIRSVIDGYNVCIFAYGQTGSGKTYTMSGANLSAAETWGVSYRSLNYLFDISKSRASIVNYDVSVQMVEIYNEQLVAVTCTQDVLDLMKAGLANRAVGATALNERSSRSHSVLTIHVKGKELASGSILKGCLHLVDLAGSERVEKSEVTGERLKEAQHINRSLSALGDVISALAQKSSHIPYRNSKLTQVLQDSLGGQAKTLMLVHINPEINAYGETISTLKFAERVSSIELGAARVNKETGELRELKEEVSTLKSKLESKEMEVQKLKEYASLADSEMHNNRAISPSNLQKCNFFLKNESIQRPLSNPGVIEFSSSSSGNQRKPHFGMTILNKEAMGKDLASRSPLSAGDSCMISRKIRSPSPPIRRSTSTDRASIIKTKTRTQTISGRPVQKLQFPEPISINKSTALVSRESTSDLYIHKFLQEQGSSRRVLHESEDQSRQALAIRKNKMESKFKYQREPQKSDTNSGVTAENIQFSETEMNCGLTNSFTGSAKVRKFQSIVARISETIESRVSIQVGEQFPRGKHENKPPNSLVQNGEEVISCNPKSELRRSRSLPRGKFMFS